MKPPVETVRLTTSAREKLIQLKRITGVEHWNSLCRWGFCFAVASRLEPTGKEMSERCNVEMAWSTFAGEWSDVLVGVALAGWQTARETHPELTVSDYFNSMLDLGIAILLTTVTDEDPSNIDALVSTAVGETLRGVKL
jgi:DNA sulfur modification protein DndE